MAYIQLADCLQDEIKSYANIIAKMGAMNDVALVFDEFKQATQANYPAEAELAAGYYYLSIGTYSTSTITATVTSADEVIEALNWFREKDWKSSGFKDNGESSTRIYTLKNKNSTNEIQFEAYFSGGTCEFVPSGKRRHIKATEAIPARKGSYAPIMELKCDDVALPTE